MEYRKQPSAATVGTFDGFHLGHRLVVDTLRTEALRRCLEPIVVTFDRHPLETVAPERAPRLVAPPSQRNLLITAEGVDVLELEFNRETAAMTVRQFMKRLRCDLGVQLLLVGYDNTFGSDGLSMKVSEYQAIGAEEGVEVINAPVLEGISSSAIRQTLRTGNVKEASRMLGYDFRLCGHVVHGRGIGHTMGFPTANLSMPYKACLPANGVYAAVANTEGNDYAAVVNVGMRPTVGNAPVPEVEAHLLGFSGNLYDLPMTLTFKERLRDEKKFSGIAALTEAITADIAKANEILRVNEPTTSGMH